MSFCIRSLSALALVTLAAACAKTSSPVATAFDQNQKIQFERRTGLIVWDQGSRPGQIDDGDDLTDPDAECGIDELKATALPREILNRNLDTAPAREQIRHLEARIGIERLGLKMNVVRSLPGRTDQPVLILLPEIHLNANSADAVKRLHQTAAMDVWAIAEKLLPGTRVINTAEGPRGEPIRETDADPRTFAERQAFVNMFSAKRWISGATLLGELFPRAITSRYHDDNKLTIKYAFSLKALAGRQPWAEVRAAVREQFPTRSARVNLDDFKFFHDQLSGRNETQLRRINTDSCEERSHRMAKYTLDLAAQEQAQVAFVSFGALHLHGILEELKARGVGALVYSPNF